MRATWTGAGVDVLPRQGSRVGFVVLLALVAWAPIPLASNRGWSAALLAAAILLLALGVLTARLWHDVPATTRASPGRIPLLLLAAWAAFALVQMLPLPAALLAVLSPAARDAWDGAGVIGAASLSLDRAASAARGIHFASLAAVFALVCWYVSSWRRLRVACATLVAIGALEAVAGIVLALARSRGWIPSAPVEGVGGISGTYVNPNHFAGLLEMCLCVSAGLSLAAGTGSGFPHSLREVLDRGASFLLSARCTLAAAQLLMVVGLLWSGSRGALLALAIAIPAVLVWAVPVAPARDGLRHRARPLLAGVVILVAALLGAGSGSLGEKLSSVGVSSDRLPAARATLAMAADYPLLGSGAGSFRSVFPAYKDDALGNAYFEHAHNDYLEFLAEGGLVGLGLFVAAVACALGPAFARARRRNSRAARAMAGGCGAGAVSLLVHGLYDFNLQIPANATVFMVVLALCVAAASMPREHRPGHGGAP